MKHARLILVTCIADVLFGDPHWLPHPVRAVGAAIAFGERIARRYGRGDARREQRVRGVLSRRSRRRHVCGCPARARAVRQSARR